LILWRITTGAHPVWSDEGARRHGGRWNVPGQGVIDAALAYSTAMLEILIHANTGRAPSNARYVAADISEDVAVEALDPAQLPGWDGADLAIPQAFSALVGGPSSAVPCCWCRRWSPKWIATPWSIPRIPTPCESPYPARRPPIGMFVYSRHVPERQAACRILPTIGAKPGQSPTVIGQK